MPIERIPWEDWLKREKDRQRQQLMDRRSKGIKSSAMKAEADPEASSA